MIKPFLVFAQLGESARTGMLQHGNKKPLSQELIVGCAALSVDYDPA